MNHGCYDQNLNESVPRRNVFLGSSNANDKDITNEKKQQNKKTKLTLHNDPSDKRKDNKHVEEGQHDETGESLIVSNQISNKNIKNRSNNAVLFSDSIPKPINIKNLKN